jgi:serine/threonine-protein kinase
MTAYVIPEVLQERFEVLQSLGHGGFAQVYEVRDRKDETHYALKVLQVGKEDWRARREVDLNLSVQHPHLLRCYEGDLIGPIAYLLLELATDSMAPELRDMGRLKENWLHLRQACQGVAALHAKGLVHRDLKPENILLTSDGAKVSDLGLIKNLDVSTCTPAEVVLGTPGYLAPEQARGEDVDARADIFSLGILFYQALEGRLPYPDVSPRELMRHVALDHVELGDRAPRLLSPASCNALQAALEHKPEDRPEDLLDWLRKLGSPIRTSAPQAKATRPQRRTPRVVPEKTRPQRQIPEIPQEAINPRRPGPSRDPREVTKITARPLLGRPGGPFPSKEKGLQILLAGSLLVLSLLLGALTQQEFETFLQTPPPAPATATF